MAAGRVIGCPSGFDHAIAGAHEKPGLTCHQAAIEAALAAVMDCYDFLAGMQPYKSSLGGVAVPLLWLEVVATVGDSRAAGIHTVM